MNNRLLLKTLCALSGASILAVSAFSTAAAAAGPVCTDRFALVKGLGTKFQEHQHGLGITSANQDALEFYASEAGFWTIIVTTTTGQSCILATGRP